MKKTLNLRKKENVIVIKDLLFLESIQIGSESFLHITGQNTKGKIVKIKIKIGKNEFSYFSRAILTLYAKFKLYWDSVIALEGKYFNKEILIKTYEGMKSK
jgi:hypothetical protein